MQPEKEMVLSSTIKLSNSLGVTTVEKQKSTKDKWLRKKYMIVWSFELTLMIMIIPKFPTTGEGNGNPLQYSCLENPMGGGAW